jgi:hypothetical protein
MWLPAFNPVDPSTFTAKYSKTAEGFTINLTSQNCERLPRHLNFHLDLIFMVYVKMHARSYPSTVIVFTLLGYRTVLRTWAEHKGYGITDLYRSVGDVIVTRSVLWVFTECPKPGKTRESGWAYSIFARLHLHRQGRASYSLIEQTSRTVYS